jgi:hypothetical protein
MSLNKKLSHLLLASTLVFSYSCQSGIRTETADSIYFGSNLFSFDGYMGSNAEAVAVKAGKVIYIGSRASAEKLRGSETEMYDLGQKMFFADLLTNTNLSSKQSESFLTDNHLSIKSLPKPEEENINPSFLHK